MDHELQQDLPRLLTTRETCARLDVAVRALDRLAACRVLTPVATLATNESGLYLSWVICLSALRDAAAR